MTESEDIFTPDPIFPQNPEFYRRVLHQLPAPVVVVTDQGQIIYINQALELMGGWDRASAVGNNIIEYVHPDDVQELTESFFDLASSDDSNTFEMTPWASVSTRLIASNGQVIPVEVTGAGGLLDPQINAIIYDVRPGHEQDILRQSLTGLAQGEPIDSILQLITDMIALPPLGLDAAVLEPRGDGTYRIIGATKPELAAILQSAHDPQPWNAAGATPQRTIVSRFPGGIGEDLFVAGYREFWHVAPEPADDPTSYRIVACGQVIQQPAAGQIARLSRANELASVVLLRARADALLEHSATHDRLTKLPNREGFHRHATEVLAENHGDTAAMLFIDLDGFKGVNDDHGHAAGDRVLQTVAKRLLSVTRSVDMVARLGGDEFVILVGASADRPANHARVRVIADRTLQELSREIDTGATNVSIAASIGAVITPMPTTPEVLLAKADAAMYEAKHNNGNQHHIVVLG